MDFQVETDDGVAEIIINVPPVNALTGLAMSELADTIEQTSKNENVKVILIYAEGRGFCAGIDIKELGKGGLAVIEGNKGAFRLFEAIHHCPVPVISAIHGYALGAGAAIAGASDVVFAAEGTKLGVPEINVGMLGGGSHMLRILPLQKVRSMYFTGDPILAEEAMKYGAFEKVVPLDSLVLEARAMAQRIAEKSPTALRYAKLALNGIEPVDLEKNYRFEQGFTYAISHLDEAQKARDAVLKKTSA